MNNNIDYTTQVTNKDMEDKMFIIKNQSILAAERIQAIFRIFGALELVFCLIWAFLYTQNANKITMYAEDINYMPVLCVVGLGVIACIILIFWGDYLYYNLTVKAYTLEFLYNNSCCIAEIDQDVNNKLVIINNNMIDGFKDLSSKMSEF